MSVAKWYLRTQDETFGPETEEKLVEWAKMGRIQPEQEVSDDQIIWQKVEDVPFLDMRFSIDIGDGKPRGPFHRQAAETLVASGRLPMAASIVEVRPPFEVEAQPVTEEPQPEIEEPQPVAEVAIEEPVVEQMTEKIIEVPVERIVEKVVEVPVEKIVEVEVPVEKIVEVPVEKIVEKEVVKEVRVEVPVEKIVEKIVEVEKPVEIIKEVIREIPVEVEKIVVDERRVKELEAQRDELSRTVDGLSAKLTEAAARETKLNEQVMKLEDELRRLPQTASEVADIQAAMFGVLKTESEEITELLETEKREFEDFKRRYLERSDRLMERRRNVLRRSGANIEEMTHKALMERPEDPRTVRLRKDLDELRNRAERQSLDYQMQIRKLMEEARVNRAEAARIGEREKDASQFRQEVESLRAQLQQREKELLDLRQQNEELVRKQATKEQVLLARLTSLESPSIGTAASMSTNQSREAKQVKLPSWMRIGK